MSNPSENPSTGFNFQNYMRNTTVLKEENQKLIDYKKTGTTIVGVICKDCVILAADARATGGSIVMEKNCMKLHYLAPNMYCAGAGTAADCNWVTEKLKAELEMMRLNTQRPSKVCHAYTRLANDLVKYGGYIGAYLIIGGMDASGRYLVNVDASGMVMSEGYCSMGSGSNHAIAALIKGFKDNMTEQEGLDLCADAITAGIIHDLGSGSLVNAVVIRKESCKEILNYKVVGKRECEKMDWNFRPNNNEILTQLTHEFEKKVVVDEKPAVKDDNKMDLE